MNYDLITESIKNLKRARVRTYLTLLGVVIGIAAIVSLVSIGSGLSVSVESQLDQLGAETILVIPGGIQNIRTKLTQDDVDDIKRISGVFSVVPIYTDSAVIEFNGEKVNLSINATDPKDSEIFDGTGFFDVSEGRFFERNESTAVLIGNNVGKNLFDRDIGLRKQIKINGENFKVIGILKAQAQSFEGGPDTGNTIYMSLDGFRRVSDSVNPGIIFVKADSKNNVSEVVDEIKEHFKKKYGEGSVNALSTEQILDTINSLLGVLTVFVMGLAGISLVVGGIGIMNAMITSVLERTKEIGLMKALGATNNKILIMFLLEAAFIGLVGGIIGILVGFGLAEIIAIIGTESGFALTAVKSIDIIIGAMFFSMVVGIGSGLYPAIRASKLDPVDALRYE